MRDVNSAAAWDTVALLSLFDAANRAGNVDGALKVQKLTFLAELAGQEAGLRTAGFCFFRYKFGPYSNVLDYAVEQLEGDDVLTDRRAPTAKGRYILDYVSDEIAATPLLARAISILRETGERYGAMTGTALKELVYGLRVPVHAMNGERQVVRDIPLNVDILDPAGDRLLTALPSLSDDAMEEISAEIAMDESLIDPSSQVFQLTVREALRRVATAC